MELKSVVILEPHYSFYSVMGYRKFLEKQNNSRILVWDWYQEEALLSLLDEDENCFKILKVEQAK